MLDGSAVTRHRMETDSSKDAPVKGTFDGEHTGASGESGESGESPLVN